MFLLVVFLVWFAFLVHWHIKKKHCWLSNAKAILLEEHRTEVWEVHAFPRGIDPKVNVIIRLETELVYYDVTVKHVNHYARETTLLYASPKNISSLFVALIVSKPSLFRCITTKAQGLEVLGERKGAVMLFYIF